MDILVEAPNLLRRYQKSDAFRRHVDDRAPLVIPVAALFLIYSLATTAGTVVTLGGTHSFLVLLMLIAAPFLLGATFLTLLFVFFSWLENRSLAQMLARVKKPARRHGWRGRLAAATLPRMPWLLLALFVLAPLVLLAKLSLAAAALMLLVVLGTPVGYAFLDR